MMDLSTVKSAITMLNLADDYKVKWNISKKTGKVTSCKIVEMSDVEIQEKIKLNNAKYGAYIKIGVGS